MKQRKEYPECVCADCGKAYGNRECGISTWHNGTCGVCGKEAAVTEPRDFGHLNAGWEKE